MILADNRLHCSTGIFGIFYSGSNIGIGVDSMKTERQEQHSIVELLEGIIL